MFPFQEFMTSLMIGVILLSMTRWQNQMVTSQMARTKMKVSWMEDYHLMGGWRARVVLGPQDCVDAPLLRSSTMWGGWRSQQLVHVPEIVTRVPVLIRTPKSLLCRSHREPPPVVNAGFGSEGGQSSPPSSISRFLQLPEVQAGPSRRTTLEPLVDYTKSIIMTSDAYIKAMEDKAARKEVLEKEKQVKKREAELTQGRRAEEKLMKETAKKQRLADVRARRAFAEKWSAKAVAQVGENLHQLIKSGAPPPPGSYVGKFVTFCPEICLRNQAITMARSIAIWRLLRCVAEHVTLVRPINVDTDVQESTFCIGRVGYGRRWV
jgi:hypothetical protein